MSFVPDLIDDVPIEHADPFRFIRPPLRRLTPRQKAERLYLIAALARRIRTRGKS